MVAAGRLKRTKRFTIKSLRGKKKGEKEGGRDGRKKGKKRGGGCRRILFVAIVSRGEKRLIHNRRVGNSRGKSLPPYFSMPVENIPFPRAVQIKSVRASVCVQSWKKKRTNLVTPKNK